MSLIDMKIKSFFTTIIIIFTSLIGHSQQFDKVKLDKYIDALEESNRFMGSVALAKDGEVIYTKAIG